MSAFVTYITRKLENDVIYWTEWQQYCGVFSRDVIAALLVCKQWYSGHVGFPNQSCWRWTFYVSSFLCSVKCVWFLATWVKTICKGEHWLLFQVISRHVELQGKHPPFEQQEQVMDFQLAAVQSSSENCHPLVLAKMTSLFSNSVSNSNFIYSQQRNENCRISGPLP